MIHSEIICGNTLLWNWCTLYMLSDRLWRHSYNTHTTKTETYFLTSDYLPGSADRFGLIWPRFKVFFIQGVQNGFRLKPIYLNPKPLTNWTCYHSEMTFSRVGYLEKREKESQFKMVQITTQLDPSCDWSKNINTGSKMIPPFTEGLQLKKQHVFFVALNTHNDKTELK